MKVLCCRIARTLLPKRTRRWGNLVPPKEDMEWGAVNIHALRKAAGMTQAQLAEWLGVTIKQIKHLEHQRRNPSGPTRRLLDILAQRIGMENGERVQVLGADAGAVGAAKPVTEEPVREAPGGDQDDAFIWQ